MASPAVDLLKSWVLEAFEETFESVQGIYLDRGTSLFETLAGIDAATASRPVSATCATLAAQVDHVRFYLDVLYGYMTGNPPEKVDWKEIWRTVSAVTPDEWAAINARLHESHQRVLAMVRGFETWDGENDISGALAVLIHTAYHLGEIRQALCTLRESGA